MSRFGAYSGDFVELSDEDLLETLVDHLGNRTPMSLAMRRTVTKATSQIILWRMQGDPRGRPPVSEACADQAEQVKDLIKQLETGFGDNLHFRTELELIAYCAHLPGCPVAAISPPTCNCGTIEASNYIRTGLV